MSGSMLCQGDLTEDVLLLTSCRVLFKRCCSSKHKAVHLLLPCHSSCCVQKNVCGQQQCAHGKGF